VPSSLIQAGELRHRITILRANLTQDTFGGWVIGDDSILADRVPAKISTLSGRELYAAQQKVAQVTHKVTIRWQRGIAAKLNIQWADDTDLVRFFQVQDVQNPDGRHIFLELLCVERNDSVRKA